ncbi:transcription/translation regulatory transformer protein RfaH [Halopseudomonas laoshanensis]|uniref:Transcription antitermination protein RfaH n=1 Tax=Halopseudomonas laoshanensis TaxID=2268758 RepID=A0A7V7GQH0_9GAMM|nr:transcription/translation regulatory transformer protein RfaH [Halopseudomonas laoshanensis]KAA0690830.1 transcription/translation regulatory transformer protein RfaH [Halopseudomonas laoshanensis]
MSETGSGSWYLIQCKPRQETRALENLRNQSFTCYAPMHPVEKIRHGKRVTLDEPLFPGYLFINLCEFTESWHPIRSTRGVLRMVTFANKTLPVAVSIVEGIKLRLSTCDKGKSLFAHGDAVAVTEGPFRDLEAIFSSLEGEERAIILLNLMHRQHELRIPLKALRAIA